MPPDAFKFAYNLDSGVDIVSAVGKFVMRWHNAYRRRMLIQFTITARLNAFGSIPLDKVVVIAVIAIE